MTCMVAVQTGTDKQKSKHDCNYATNKREMWSK